MTEIERRMRRDDSAGLHGIAELNQQFATVMADASDDASKRTRLAPLWPALWRS